jgi:hypothetical protein
VLYFILNFSPSIDKKIEIEVLATEELSKISYDIIGQGTLILSNSINVMNGKSSSFNFFGTFNMLPKATLLVYYVRPSGDLISDRVVIEFSRDFKNYVWKHKLNLVTNTNRFLNSS